MFRKFVVSLCLLIGIVLLASCGSAQFTPTSEANMPNPASVYCEEQGNQLEIVTAEDGSQSGVCIFPDGSSCEEWAYFNGDCGPADESVSPAGEESGPVIEEYMVYQEETAPAPAWIPPNAGGGAPWFEDLSIAASSDGMTFEEGELFIPHSGVGHLLLTPDDLLIATFQYFSYTNEELFDRIAYTVSEDFGQTWSSIRPVNIDVPGSGPGRGPNPVDPTLVQLSDGSFRLYFTFQLPGDEFPQLYSAHSDTIDGLFSWEGKQLSTEQMILDPAVVFFNGVWHHYTTSHELSPEGLFNNVHSTSADGLNFERQDDVPLEMSFLGCAVEVDGGLRFYEGRSSAFSTDGFDWEIEPGDRRLGPDPGVVALPDGSYLAIFTNIGEK